MSLVTQIFTNCFFGQAFGQHWLRDSSIAFNLFSMKGETILIQLSQVLVFVLPFILAGLTHIIVIKYNLLQSLANLPLDFGLTIRGHRLFGKNKTFRGAVVMIFGITFWILFQAFLAHYLPFTANLAFVNFSQVPPLIWGFLLGVGCVIGELPNSFIKRQLEIDPGNHAGGVLKPLFWTIDQVDSLVGALVLVSYMWQPTLGMLLILFLCTLVIHPIGGIIMYRLGLKRNL